jgi:rubrerythrin
MDINKIAAEVAKNNAGEQVAIQGYFDLMACVKGAPQAFYDDIGEIISDEMNHAQKLAYWETYLTGIKAAKD